MRSFFLNKITNKVLQWSLLAVSILFLFYVIAVTNISFFNSFLQGYGSQITARLSTIAGRPIKISSFTFTNHNLQPVFAMHDVDIFDANASKSLMHVHEIRVGINVWRSLWRRDVVQDWIGIDGTTLNVQSDVDKKTGFSINGINLAVSLGDSAADEAANLPNATLLSAGAIKTRLTNITLVADKWFSQPIIINDFRGDIDWRKTSQELNINIKRLILKNATLRAKGKIYAEWKLPNENLPQINAQIDFFATRLDKLHYFFPEKIMAPGLVNWLKTAFSAVGHIDGKLVLRGNLTHFPFEAAKNSNYFDNNSEIFKIDIALHDLDFLYYQPWPKMQNLYGHLLFKGRSMDVLADSATMVDMPLHNVTARIDNLAQPVLTINGQVNTLAPLAQKFINVSPLQNTLGKYFTYIDLDGRVNVGLHLIIPLFENGSKAQVNGVVNFAHNTLMVKPWDILLHDIGGAVNFTDTNISADHITTVLFDKLMALKINTTQDQSSGSKKQDKITKIVFNHTIPIATLAQHFAIPVFSYLDGDLTCQGTLQLAQNPGRNSTFEIISDLRDVAINYPPLLVKPIGVSHDFNMRYVFLNGVADTQIFLAYKNILSAALNFTKRKDVTTFSAGELRLGAGQINNISAASGLVISGELGKLNWEEWRRYFLPSDVKAQNNKTPFSIAVWRQIVKNIDVKINELHIFDQIFTGLHLVAVPEKDEWILHLDSSAVKGVVSIPNDFKQAAITANLQKVDLVNTDSLKKSTLRPKDMPKLNIEVADLHYGDKTLGKFAVQTEPESNGLKIVRLLINAANFVLEGAGDWIQDGKGSKSFLQGKVVSKNAGGALQQLHFTESLVDGSGELSFALDWRGAFYDIDTASLNGDVKVNLHKGRIINLGEKTEAEMGIGRLLSVLGLQTLPRRLSLDFSDLVKGGFSFDVLHGAFKFTNGNAFTKNMELVGPAAKVQVKGRIGFAAKDYDILLTVIPHVTSSLPIIATVAGGPFVGAATFVADKLIGGQVTRVLGYVYKISGSWVQPSIQKQ